MTKFEIRNRFSNKVQFVAEIDCASAVYSLAYKMRFAVQWAKQNNVCLHEAKLVGANLAGVTLDIDLRFADLRFADLSFADLSRANLYGADLSHADLIGAKLPSIENSTCLNTKFHAATS